MFILMLSYCIGPLESFVEMNAIQLKTKYINLPTSGSTASEKSVNLTPKIAQAITKASKM